MAIGLIWMVLASSSNALAQVGTRPIEKAAEQRREADIEPASPSEKPEGSQEESDSEEPVAENDYTPYGVDIQALVLVPLQEFSDPVDPALPHASILIDSKIEAPEDLHATLETFLGKPVSAGLLTDLAKAIILAWRSNDHPLVDVYFPEQNITQGKVQIVVREAVLGEVRVKGAKHTRESYLKRQLRVHPQDRINQRIARNSLDWINQNPIRTVNLIYEKGQADGTSDIVLDVKEQPAMTLYGGFANTGLELTGENEVSAGFNISNPFATEQSLGYNFNSTIDFDSLTSHTLFYQAFLPWRHTLRLSGAYVLSHAETAQGFLPLNLDGENLQVSADYEVWLPRAQTGWFSRLRHSFFLGIDYKSTNTNFLFGGTEVFDTTGVVFQSRLGYDALLRDDLGFTRLNLGLTYSPGGVFSGNDDASFQALRRGSSADYWYGFAELERGFRLPGDWSFVLRSSGQWTSSRLISTEQILAGGYRTARGYDENLIRGDSGVIASAELMAPKFSILSNERDQWNLFGFYDAAFLQVTHRGEGEPNPNLQSAGLGLNVKLGQTAFARLAYGWVVSFDGVDQALVGSGKLHFGITLRF